MLIHRMNATFGKLRDSTLELKDGLNILQAPTEAGKSTWCAFLLSMFYGVDPLEERYLPWSGEAMRGEIDCYALGREWTLRRSTPRPDRPLAALEAVCMDGGGPGQEAPELSGENCGETLLGVTREVYEQGALIRRAGVSALPGVPDGQPFWNVYANKFIFAPAFDFPEAEEKSSIRVMFDDGRIIRLTVE